MAYKVREAEIKFKIVTLKCRPSKKKASTLHTVKDRTVSNLIFKLIARQEIKFKT